MTTRLLKKMFRARFTGDPIFRDNFYKSLRTDTRVHKQPTELFRVDPPSIFCGRDPKHPLRGTCRYGVYPADVTVNTQNITNEQRASLVRSGFTRFVRDPETRWIATWKDEVTGENRYVFAKPKKSDIEAKFEIARKLHHNLVKVRRRLTNPELVVLLYLVEHLCIRIGHEKDTEVSANTVGCCTLLAYTHVRVINPLTRTVHLKFHGKDSVVYDKQIIFPKNIFMCLKKLFVNKKPGERLFTVTPRTINSLLRRCVPGATAKTFRTMRASVVYERALNKQGPRAANESVAELLNHQKKTGLNLDTSRKNYIDPRIYFAYCKRMRMDPGKSFAEHAHWAGNVSSEFCFVK